MIPANIVPFVYVALIAIACAYASTIAPKKAVWTIGIIVIAVILTGCADPTPTPATCEPDTDWRRLEQSAPCKYSVWGWDGQWHYTGSDPIGEEYRVNPYVINP
jgi:hypothetical protein